jgi:hypothetical protein
MHIKPRDNCELRHAIKLQGNTPLYERVPTHDEHGRSLNDFMMIFPGLRELPEIQLQKKIRLLAAVLGQCNDVVYVDLNLPLNLLWVSVRQKPGLVLELSTCVKASLPEAVLIGVPPDAIVRRRK